MADPIYYDSHGYVLYKIGPFFLHARKSYARNGRRDSTPRILTLIKGHSTNLEKGIIRRWKYVETK